MKIYKVKVKSRDWCSQNTGYERIKEWQFIISIDETNNDRVMIIGRWFPTANIAKLEAWRTAKFLKIKLDWNK